MIPQNLLVNTSITEIGTQLVIEMVEDLGQKIYLPTCKEWEYWQAVAAEFSDLKLSRVDTNKSQAQLSFLSQDQNATSD